MHSVGDQLLDPDEDDGGVEASAGEHDPASAEELEVSFTALIPLV